MLPIALFVLLQSSTSATEAATNQFQALETKVSGALQAKNRTALDEILAKDFAYSLFLEGRAPEVLNRNEALQFAGSLYELSGFEIRHVGVRVFGSLAVVALQPASRGSVGTVERSGEFAIVDIWTKIDGAWRLSSRYVSRPDVFKR